MNAYVLVLQRLADETYSITINGNQLTYTPRSAENVIEGLGAKIREMLGGENYSVFEDDLKDRIVVAPERKKAKLDIKTKDPKITITTAPISEPVNQRNLSELLSDLAASRAIQPFPAAIISANVQPQADITPEAEANIQPLADEPRDAEEPPADVQPDQPDPAPTQPTANVQPAQPAPSQPSQPQSGSVNTSDAISRIAARDGRGVFLQDGRVIPVTVPASVRVGNPVKVGSIRGIAISSGSAGESVGVAVNGVYLLRASVDLAIGDKVFWTPGGLAKSGTHQVGICLDSVGANAEARVLLA